MMRRASAALAQAFCRTALPLAAYYTVTLAIPLVNGAARSGDAFVGHAVVVLLAPPAAIALGCGVHAVVRAFVTACRLARWNANRASAR